MKIRKPSAVSSIRTCPCGHMRVVFGPEQIRVQGGWIRVHQHAVCTECQHQVRIAPEIALLDRDGEVFHVLQS